MNTPHRRQHRATAWIVASALGLTAGCAPPEGCLADAGSTLLAGAADPADESAFVALSPDRPLYIERGAQGGGHVWIQLRTRNMCPLVITTEIGLYLPGRDTPVARYRDTGQRWWSTRDDPTLYASAPLRVVVDLDLLCEFARAPELRARATVRDSNGRTEQLDLPIQLRSQFSTDHCPQPDAGPDAAPDAALDAPDAPD